MEYKIYKHEFITGKVGTIETSNSHYTIYYRPKSLNIMHRIFNRWIPIEYKFTTFTTAKQYVNNVILSNGKINKWIVTCVSNE